MSFIQIAQSLDPFLDPEEDLYIQVTVEGKAQVEVLPLDSRPGRAVLRARLCDVLKKGYPTDHETRSAFEVIYGYAFERERQIASTSIGYLMARKPLAQAIVIIAKSGGTEATPTQLLAKVNTVAARNSIDTTSEGWPHSEDSLGKRLSALGDLLKKAGVKMERSKGKQRKWTIEPIEVEESRTVERDSSDERVVQVTPSNDDYETPSSKSDTCPNQNPHIISMQSCENDDELLALSQGANK